MTVILDPLQLKEIMPNAKDEDIDFYLDALNRQLNLYEINTPLRQAHFIAQIAHESGAFRYKSENLNYSAKALKAVFGKYFPTEELAQECARKPEKIANSVYANRMGNSDTESGDGWKYRGRGLIQLTGCENYKKCSQVIGKDLIEEPDLLIHDPDIAVGAACWFWDMKKLNRHADEDDLKTITKKINGGYHGLEDRASYLDRAKKIFNF
jgi:putative chitinase